MNQRLVITCNGKHLDMASSFMLFLMNRKGTRFCYGDWLLTLSDKQLHRFYELGEDALLGNIDSFSHLLEIAVIALAAEQRVIKVIAKPEIVDNLHWLTTLEQARRHGLVTITIPVRLSEVEQLQHNVTNAMLDDCLNSTFH